MPYRSQLEAIRARHDSLEHDLADVRRLIDQVATPRPARRTGRRIATGAVFALSLVSAFAIGMRVARPALVARQVAVPVAPSNADARAAAARATHDEPVWRTATPPTFADVSLSVNDQTIHFAKSCASGGVDDLASSITSRKPRRPEAVNVTGCDGSYAYFHLWLAHPPEPGPATTELLMIRLPGGDLQDPPASASRFQITNVTEDRIAGTFEVDLVPAHGAAPVHARGSFDVPRRPDDTTPGP